MRIRLPTSNSRGGAFTLIEVLIATAVFAVVLVSMHGVFYGALRLRNKTTAEVEKVMPLQHALAIIKRDLEGLAAPGGTLTGALRTSPTNSVAPRGRIMSGPPLCTATGQLYDTLPWAELQKVTYYLAEPTNRTSGFGLDLHRAVTRNLLPLLIEDEPEDQWLMGGVERIEFWFHDGSAWRTTWDWTSETTPLPRGVRMDLELTPQPDQQYDQPVISVVVPLLVQASTNTSSQANQSASGTGGSGGS